ncbi:MAG TPA: aspartate aminotransferase family protein [Dehalococcoidia bacterium]
MTLERKTIEALGEWLPVVNVEPPGPRSRALAGRLARAEAPAASTLANGDVPVFWEAARGANVADADGNVYVDLTSAFGVASVGHGNPAVLAAAEEQAARLLHGMGDFQPPTARLLLAEALAEVTPDGLSQVIFGSTGSEAVELALKAAAVYTGKPGVVAFRGAFHGQSYGALAVTSRRSFRAPFQAQLNPHVVHVPYPYPYRCPFGPGCDDCGAAAVDHLEGLLSDPSSGLPPVGAVIVEPCQGREGEIVPPPSFLLRLRELCDRHGLLLIADEVYTGLGRTGRWFAVEHAGVVPDLLCVGKALGGGYPISAVVGRPEVMAAWRPVTPEAPHSSTFMGHPVGCAAGLAVLAELRGGLLERAARMGAWFGERLGRLASHRLVGEVRGLGMMWGVELVRDRRTKEPADRELAGVVAACLREGVILLPGGRHGNVLSLSPPFVITEEQAEHALGVLDRALAAFD